MIPFHLKGSHRQNVTCLVSSESVGQKKCQKQLHKIVQGNAESRRFFNGVLEKISAYKHNILAGLL